MSEIKPEQVTCGQCGMVVVANEFHTYTYCLLMKQTCNGDSVRTNIEYTVSHHPMVADLKAQVAELTEANSRYQKALEHYADREHWKFYQVDKMNWRIALEALHPKQEEEDNGE